MYEQFGVSKQSDGVRAVLDGAEWHLAHTRRRAHGARPSARRFRSHLQARRAMLEVLRATDDRDHPLKEPARREWRREA
jgi:hypothetical protein